jgi:hypothetical protein
MWPDNSALHQVEESTACHPLYRHSLDCHLLKRAHKREISLNSVSWEAQAIGFDGLQSLKLRKDINLGSHLAHIHLECNEAAEYGCKLGLGKVVNGISTKRVPCQQAFHASHYQRHRGVVQKQCYPSHGFLILNDASAFTCEPKVKAGSKEMPFVVE